MKNDQYERQSFLGSDAQGIFERARIGLIGLSGGGSHIAQQAAYLGFKNFTLFDQQTVEESNLNRLVGATPQDVADELPKVDIAERVIRSIQPDAEIQKCPGKWQDYLDQFRSSDLTFGCVDSYLGRYEMEVSARRFMMPLIDIGMDVYEYQEGMYTIGGQVILSLPGQPCMTCLGFLNESSLSQEARRYGDAGSNPQVVWSNGVLASTAVGIGVELLTNWTKSIMPPLYLTYDGKRGLLQAHPVLALPRKACRHFATDKVGDPVLRRV